MQQLLDDSKITVGRDLRCLFHSTPRTKRLPLQCRGALLEQHETCDAFLIRRQQAQAELRPVSTNKPHQIEMVYERQPPVVPVPTVALFDSSLGVLKRQACLPETSSAGTRPNTIEPKRKRRNYSATLDASCPMNANENPRNPTVRIPTVESFGEILSH
eukprot:scaffold41493_cov222-Skeletonema_dohrnii-CCMP3373.AAC.1